MIIVLGIIFISFGGVMFLWGHHERLTYRDALTQKPDMREFMTNWPPRWWLYTLDVGGFAAMAVGVVLLAIGLALLRSGG